MKTIEEFIKEIESSADLQNELKEIKDKDALADFLKKHDVSGTAEDFHKAVQAKAGAEGAISDDDAEAVAGGLGDAFWEFGQALRRATAPCRIKKQEVP